MGYNYLEYTLEILRVRYNILKSNVLGYPLEILRWVLISSDNILLNHTLEKLDEKLRWVPDYVFCCRSFADFSRGDTCIWLYMVVYIYTCLYLYMVVYTWIWVYMSVLVYGCLYVDMGILVYTCIWLSIRGYGYTCLYLYMVVYSYSAWL